MWLILLLVVILLFIFLLVINRSSKQKGFWKQYGIKEVDASTIVSDLDFLLKRKDLTERDDNIYNVVLGEDESFCGSIEKPTPVLYLKDLDLVKRIYIKNFDHFVDRRPLLSAARKDCVLLKMLGNLRGDEWKSVRASVTPTFTTGKIRRMMGSINSVGAAWVKALNDSRRIDKDDCPGFKIHAYKCMSIYTADVIAEAIFGIHVGISKNPDSLFFKMANRLTNLSTFQSIKFALSLHFPRLFRFFNIAVIDMEALIFFEELLNGELQERKRCIHKGIRNDFLQLLVEAKSIGKQEPMPQDINGNVGNEGDSFLTDEIMRGQCMSFFFAGFRTTCTVLTFAMYALALYPDIQERIRQEANGIVKQDGSLTYEDAGRLTYLDMFICEVLRKFPTILRLERMCITDFHDPETGLFIPKGAFVAVPVYSIHHDSKFYDNPQEFDPEHFSADAKARRNPYAFNPFGIGPRSCIGMRFALLESKAALVYLVRNFLVQPTENTPIPLAGKRENFQIAPPDNLEVRLVPLKR